MTHLIAPVLLALALAMALAASPAAATDAGDAESRARQVVDRLEAGEFEAIWQSFAPDMQAAVSAETLAQGWSSLALQLGELRSRGAAQTSVRNDATTIVTPLLFEHGALEAIVTVDAQGLVSGLFLRPSASAPPPAPAEAPPADAGYEEHDFSVGEGATALPGTLAMPAGDGPFPAVVLVHGSGPNDRDGTIGPNRPLLDIARGLAAQGVAVLRYDKRTRVHPQAAAADPDFGVDEEATDDAIAAVAALRATPGIDPERVFVFGHSLGAILAPRIVQRAQGAAGAVLLAAPSRPTLDLVPEQIERMAQLQGGDPAATQAMLDSLVESIARIRSGEDVSAAQAPLGAPAAYWRSLEAVDTVADARALSQPLLILHGGRDIQVTDTDWRGWEAAFADDPRVTLKRYPALSHLGIAVAEGAAPLAVYQQPGNVDAELIDDVAAWIARH